MASTPRFTRRHLLGAAALVPLVGGAAACSDSGDAPALSGGSDYKAIADAMAKIIAKGPVADDAAIAKSPWASAIKKADKLRRGGTTTNSVFSLKDPATGKVTGFDAGITQLLARYILGDGGQDRIDYLDTTVDTRETMIQNGTVDCIIATYSITKPRMEKVNFAGPYYLSGTSIEVKADNKDIKSVKDLTGKKLVTESNSTGITAIKEHVKDPAEVKAFAENDQCLAALKQGRYDAYVLDQSVLLGNAQADPSVKVVGEPFTVDPYGIGLSKEHPDALEFVNEFLTKIEQDGAWKELWTATVGRVIEGNAPTPPQVGKIDLG